MFTQDDYTTPEGFYLPKPLLLPDVRDFSEVLEYLGEWDHETMSARAGRMPQTRPEPRILRQSEWAEGFFGAIFGPSKSEGNEVGPYCSVDLSQLGGPGHRGIAVRATDALMAAVAPRIVTDDDHLSFRVIGHKGSARALVILNHGQIIGDHWVAYIDPATIPAR